MADGRLHEHVARVRQHGRQRMATLVVARWEKELDRETLQGKLVWTPHIMRKKSGFSTPFGVECCLYGLLAHDSQLRRLLFRAIRSGRHGWRS